MKKLVVSLSAFLFSFSVWAATAAQPLDKIVAIVNDQVITQSQLDKRMNTLQQQAQATHMPLPDAAKLRSQVIDQLIDEKILLMLAARNNLKITDQQLDKVLENIANNNHMNIDQLKTAVAKQGMNYQDFRQQIRNQLIMQQVQRGALGNVAVSNAEVEAFLKKNSGGAKQYQVQDGLIPLPAQPSAAQLATARQQAQQLVVAWQKGNPMPAGVQMNDLGWRTLENMPTLFASIVATMKVGSVSNPIQAPNGLHVLKLLSQRSAGGQSLTAVQARQILMQKKMDAKMGPWMKHLRATAYIKIMP